jgi:hypothetical protein
MPKQPASGMILGLQVTGDLAGVTYVQLRQNRRTSYAKTYPSKTPSQLQEYRRTRFKNAMAAYKSLSAENKSTLEEITNHYKMCMTGHNLFLSCYLTGQMKWLEEYAAGADLPWTP